MASVVTTFNHKGYELYGKRFLETWQRWPRSSTLYVYAEKVEVPPQERVEVRDLLNVPGLVEFKARHRHRQFSDYRWDAVRFAHKVFAVIHAARTLKGKMFWSDADVVAHAAIPEDFLESCLPAKSFTSCLNREGMYSECGFVGYNLDHELMPSFIDDFEKMYTEDRLFALSEYHDSYIYDVLRKQYEKKGAYTHSLSGKWASTTHPFINCDLGKYLDHLKGPRKMLGKSKPTDLRRKRLEPYWT